MFNLFSATTEITTELLNVPGWHWGMLLGWFAFLIILDMAVINRGGNLKTFKNAAIQTTVWISLGLLLGVVFWYVYGAAAASQYFSGFLIEESLSIDNVFAWAVVLSYFKIPKIHQYRALFWGIIGALFMRAIFIFAGIAAIERFEGVLIFFGLILLYSGYKIIAHSSDDEFDPSKSKMLSYITNHVKISPDVNTTKLFIKENGKTSVTVMFMALVAIGVTDAIFAVDSVPAVLAVSRDPFIVVASNAAALLGLRSLYFVFDVIKDKFWLLNKALGILLVGIGLKLVVSPSAIFGYQWFGIHTPNGISLAIIGSFIAGAIVLSTLIDPPKDHAA